MSEVLKELPEDTHYFLGHPKTAFANEKLYYFCKFCEGWVEGKPTQKSWDNIGPLCGRRGWSDYCRRCRKELCFHGCMA